ncbi:MAG: hypothetical protein KBT15_10450 [Bacteroidales bacterium]|nr:hypothetical protein [Candidatus Minthousia equi]
MIKRILFVVLMILVTAGANAQQLGRRHATSKGEWFLGVRTGISHSLTENTLISDFIHNRPSFDIMGGKLFNQRFGIRISAGIHQQMSRPYKQLRYDYPDIYDSYQFNLITAYVEGMVNLGNLFARRPVRHMLNVYLFAGVGGNGTFGFSKKVKDWERYPVDSKGNAYMAGRAGLLLSSQLTKHMELIVEGACNVTDDRYNGVKYGFKMDGYISVMAGVNWRFVSKRQRLHDAIRRKQKKEGIVPDKNKIKETRIEANGQLSTSIPFYEERSFVNETQRLVVGQVAIFLAEHPDVNVVMTGYPDSMDAYGPWNEKLAQQRVQAVYDMLVKDYGIAPSRLTMEYKTDRLSPVPVEGVWVKAVVFNVK